MLNKLIREFPPELRLMLASANSDLAKTQEFLQQPIDLDKFLRLSGQHRMYPLVYETLSRMDSLLVPGHILDVLRQKCRENTLHALHLTGEMVRIGNLLKKQNISVVVLKGAPLSCRLYGDVTARSSRDIDMLVTADKLEQSIAILENEGYHLKTENDSYNLTPRQRQIYLKHHAHSSHFEYWNSEKRVMLEIHWELSKYGIVLPFPSKGNVKETAVAGNALAILSDEELLLYLVLHGAGHQWHRLCWLIDIKKFIQQEKIDWIRIDRLAEELGMRSLLNQALILVNQVFEADLPPDMEPGAVRDRNARRLAALVLQKIIIEAGDQAGPPGIYSFYVNKSYGLYMRRGFKNKFKYVLKLLGPAVEDIKLVALPDCLYTLYYIIGPVTYIIRRFTKINDEI